MIRLKRFPFQAASLRSDSEVFLWLILQLGSPCQLLGSLLARKRSQIHRWWCHGVTCTILLALAGCGARSSGSTGSVSERGSPPQRIISLSPNVTEILAGVGAFDRVVAVSEFCDYPPETQKLPRVGGWQITSLEQVKALRPDLVIFAQPQAPFVQTQLNSLGLKNLAVNGLTLREVVEAIEKVGRATGNEVQGESLAKQVMATLDEVRIKTQQLDRPKVLCVVDRVPGTLRDLYTATEGSFLCELIEIAGGQCISPRATGGYSKISLEAVVALDPAIVIDMVQGAKGRFSENPGEVWQQLSEVSAVREGRVYPIRETSVLHPSQFVAGTARRFAKIVHPEVFPE
jgi:cobalamin transport system substrate-binding protein